MTSSPAWLPWALGSAAFAALTAIFAKIGLEGIDSDFATLLRTVVIVAGQCVSVIANRTRVIEDAAPGGVPDAATLLNSGT